MNRAVDTAGGGSGDRAAGVGGGGGSLVLRDGAHQITVRDDRGRELLLLTNGYELEVWRGSANPRLTPQMANDLADELRQWAACQQTVLRRRRSRRAGATVERIHAEPGDAR